MPAAADPGRRGWRVCIDRGGTFTDLVAQDPAGHLHVAKVLSEQPDQPHDPALAAIAALLQQDPGLPLPPGLIEEVRLGTTVATNALLERQVAPVLLLVNRGLADLLWIGDQHRPDIFALQIERPRPLAVQVVEVAGRLAADGDEVEPLALDAALEVAVDRAMAAGVGSVAVALLHAARHPRHELALGAWLEQRGLGPVLLSHRVSGRLRLVPRLHTTLVEAALWPVLQRDLQRFQAQLGSGARLRVITSAGALQAPASLQAKDTILSGPAGGMVGAVAAVQAAGLGDRPVLGFDMGGTSTDVFHWHQAAGPGAWDRRDDTTIDGLRLQASMLPIHTVAAGGGSVLSCQAGRLLVGPRSAGADPGPACYRRGGPATLTDANLVLGRLPLQALPAVFGPDGQQGADRQAALERLEALADQLRQGDPQRPRSTPERLAQGARRIAVERMAEAIRRISIQRGHSIAGAVLVSYGGAGGQHACALAEVLGLTTVLLHPLAGVLSAWGIGRARQALVLEATLRHPLVPASWGALTAAMQRLEQQARARLEASGDLAPAAQADQHWSLELRSAASDQGLTLAWPAALQADPAVGIPGLVAAFSALHRQRFGYAPSDGELVLERLLLEMGAPEASPDAGLAALAPQADVEAVSPPALPPAQALPLWLPEPNGADPEALVCHSVPCWQRQSLVPGQRLQGPALVLEATGTTVLDPGWEARVLAGSELLLERQAVAPGQAPAVTAPLGAGSEGAAALPDPVQLELYNHRFCAIAEQMGVRLQQTSRSVNIRERLDFSCALFDGQGRLVANAPHIPVHLGSMGQAVAALRAAVARGDHPPLAPGDAVASNDPYDGGTHLPDITVISPVFVADEASPAFYVACRGHHADVGGLTPGSMPPFSRSIDEEGLLLAHVPLVRGGVLDRAAWQQRLAAGPWPVRNPEQLLADLQAQVAANQLGVEELQRLVERQGLAEVRAYMAHGQAHAAEAVRQVIDRLQDGAAVVERDDGSRLAVAVRVDHRLRRVCIDCRGTSPQQPGNTNAPLAITRAVVLYVFRTLVGQPIPLNDGCFEPIDLLVPEGSLLHPRPPAAVVAGNVETSQALADALFAALGVMAGSQGTMNNLSFGDGQRQYYETICGGTGAGFYGPLGGFAGASAVQSHMTNSRLTDPELLEDRYPVRLWQFGRRLGSGGRGRWSGGDGVVRELEFLAPLTLALLANSRQVAPQGLRGGGAGQPGRHRWRRGQGPWQELPGCCQLHLEPGDRLRIETPGGGGYGLEAWAAGPAGVKGDASG